MNFFPSSRTSRTWIFCKDLRNQNEDDNSPPTATNFGFLGRCDVQSHSWALRSTFTSRPSRVWEMLDSNSGFSPSGTTILALERSVAPPAWAPPRRACLLTFTHRSFPSSVHGPRVVQIPRTAHGQAHVRRCHAGAVLPRAARTTSRTALGSSPCRHFLAVGPRPNHLPSQSSVVKRRLVSSSVKHSLGP